jgi:hypothetical protein
MKQRDLPADPADGVEFTPFLGMRDFRRVHQILRLTPSWRLELQITFGRWRNWQASSQPKLQIWPKFKLALAKREWVIYPFFALLVVIFFWLLPRGCDHP